MKINRRQLVQQLLPKSIYRHKGQNGYNVIFRSRKYNKTINVGNRRDLSEAIELRDKFIKENIHDVLEGYLPRGITRARNRFIAKLNFETNEFYLGSYETIEEAVEARTQYLEMMK